MQAVTVPQITEQLYRLPNDGLAAVYDFISRLLDRGNEQVIRESISEAYQTMLASEAVLRLSLIHI